MGYFSPTGKFRLGSFALRNQHFLRDSLQINFRVEVQKISVKFQCSPNDQSDTDCRF